MTAEPIRINCDTHGCPNESIPFGRWCDDCTIIVWRTGRPPELGQPVRLPEWRKHDLARDESGRAQA